jgi:(1->4)-alpha-D-glucan 1-alpha-D-glucosylmutase
MDLRATYRLQLGPSLTFAGARELVPYLAELGISHLYLSPVTQARHGSTHGYDVTDPTRISDDLGGEQEFRKLCGAGLGVILDLVPNHMAVSDENPFWRDPELRARFFDLDPETGRHRRFFDIDELAGVRVEDPDVFEVTHRLVLDLAAEGVIEGVRVDHVDGLANPREYLERLRAGGIERVWVEKIVELGEDVPPWPIAGTTGYEFANDVQALFVDPAGETILSALVAERRPFSEVAFEAKLEQAQTVFEPELERLRRLLDLPDLARAIASLPVYRTYVEPATGTVLEADRGAVAGLPPALRRVLLLEEPGHDAFVTRFQQTSGAVMAKGVEDTAFYRYVRLLALNEVGGDPGRFGLTIEAFHRANAARAERFPSALLAGTTHDTKRSADVRARIGALSGLAERWSSHVARWRELNEPLRTGGAPDRDEELLIYQTLVGAWPIPAERLVAYVEKALHEEKRHTSWTQPDDRWDSAVAAFCRGLYEHESFLSDFVPFAREVAEAGERAAIGQLILRLTSPGVPDIYGGDELWYLALVDPDNRRPIDWALRRAGLDGLRAGEHPTHDSAKLWVLERTLALKARRPASFDGAYTPLESGATTCAFRRGEDVVVAVPVRGEEATFELPTGNWKDVLDGIEDVLPGFRPRLLERADGGVDP